MEGNASVLFNTLIGFVVVLAALPSMGVLPSIPGGSVLHAALPVMLVVAASLASKLGTLRLLDNAAGSAGIRHVTSDGQVMFYDHKETDEKIFEVS